MKKTKKSLKYLASIFLIIFVFGCMKQNVEHPEIARLISQYNLSIAPLGVIANLKFSSVSELEGYLKNRSRRHLETKRTRVERYIAKAKQGGYIYNSEDHNILYNSITQEAVKRISSFENEYGFFGCHNPDFSFEDRWSNLNYDGGTDMRLGFNYSTNSYGMIGNITAIHVVYGDMPTSFSISNEHTTQDGDKIRTSFTSTQTNTISVMGFTITSTTVSEWVIELNTCDHTKSTSVSTY